MKTQTWSFLILSAALATPAFAQSDATIVPHSLQFEAASGPVTVRWGQPVELPNAADYAVRIEDLDRNGDGVLSRGEIPSGHALNSEFILVDSNHDGRITADELANWR